MITQETIGRAIRIECAKRDWSAKQLAEALGTSSGSARLYLKGQIFDVRRLYDVATLFDMTIDDLVVEKGSTGVNSSEMPEF